MSRTKLITINTLILVLMFAIIEITFRIYLSRRDFNSLATIEFAKKVRVYLKSIQYRRTSEGQRELRCLANAANDYSKETISPFYQKYEQGLKEFLKIANNIPVTILYLPSVEKGDLHKDFFSDLSRKYSLEFIDMSNTLRTSGKYDTWTLSPENGHLSRFGNKIIAKQLSIYLFDKFNNDERIFYRDKKNIKSHIASLKPSKSSIWNIDPRMVYRVYTNKNGFRTKDELKSDANIVIVYGDSFTFGPYLANHDTYPELANKNLLKFGAKNIQLLNAGVAGSTIFHEVETLKKTVNLKPNLIILQVLDNDIFGVSYAKMRHMQPVKISNLDLFKPSLEELKIIENCNLEK